MHLNAPWSELWLHYLTLVLFTDLSVLCRWTGVTTFLIINYSLKYLKQNTEFLSGHTETPASHQLTYTTTVKLIITYHALFLKMSLHTLPPQPIVSHVQSDPEIFMSHQSWICLSSCCCRTNVINVSILLNSHKVIRLYVFV